MVEKIIYYKCTICKCLYSDLYSAEKCEQKGKPELYPIGLIFCLPNYENIIFAVIKQQELFYNHNHSYSTWACRDTPVGDNAGSEEYCGLLGRDKIMSPNKKIPAYKRMIKALKKHNIQPIDYIEKILKR